MPDPEMRMLSGFVDAISKVEVWIEMRRRSIVRMWCKATSKTERCSNITKLFKIPR